MMCKPFVQEENELKLNLLHALVDSQRALATIMEQVASIVVVSEPAARHVLHHVHLLTSYQKALAEKMALIRVKEIKHGQACEPWLSKTVKIEKVQ